MPTLASTGGGRCDALLLLSDCFYLLRARLRNSLQEVAVLPGLNAFKRKVGFCVQIQHCCQHLSDQQFAH